MDYNNPENGSLNHIKMFCARAGFETPLQNFDKVTTIDVNAVDSYEHTIITSNSSGYIPGDRNDTDEWKNGKINKVDKITKWHSKSNNYIPSPYIKLNRNEVLCPQYNSNATSDFNGKYNTKILTSLHTAEDCKTSPTITNSYDYGCYTAPVCCSRYKTEGTQSGDWYLPAIGELGFIGARYNIIQNSLISLGPKIATNFDYECYYWSSTEYDERQFWGMWYKNQNIYPLRKGYLNFVRAFLMF